MPIFNHLPVAFPWYNDIRMQNRYRENVDNRCDYKLISPRNALLPFQFWRVASLAFPVNWYIREVDSQIIVADLTPSFGLLKVRTSADSRDYFFYNGEALTTTAGNLNLDYGYYESFMVFPGNVRVYSEMFHIPDISFSTIDQFTTAYLRLEWWNETDLYPIFYNSSDPVNHFRNVAYLDTFIHASEPEISEDTEKDGNDNDIPTFQKMTIRYNITHMVPNFLKIAIVAAQLHDHVLLTTPLGVESGELTTIITEGEPDQESGLDVITIRFEQDVAMIKRGCNNQINLNNISGAIPVLTTVVTQGANLVFTGVATANTFISIYGAVSQTATFNLIANYRAASLLNSGQLTLPVISAMGYTWFKVRSYTYNQDFGLSNAKQKT